MSRSVNEPPSAAGGCIRMRFGGGKRQRIARKIGRLGVSGQVRATLDPAAWRRADLVFLKDNPVIFTVLAQTATIRSPPTTARQHFGVAGRACRPDIRSIPAAGAFEERRVGALAACPGQASSGRSPYTNCNCTSRCWMRCEACRPGFGAGNDFKPGARRI